MNKIKTSETHGTLTARLNQRERCETQYDDLIILLINNIVQIETNRVE